MLTFFKGRGLLALSSRLQYYQLSPFQYARTLYSQNRKWDPEFNNAVRSEIEQYWRSRVQASDQGNRYCAEKCSKQKYYVLSMFPYPSGALHMGHVRVYAISDVMARYYRLQGYNVLHPMGWDAFGLPAENAAIDRGEQPANWTYKNINNMRTQLEDLCLSFDWDMEFMTCDPAYYKWTQYIFLKMYKAGLVYQKEAPVNWDPVDQTVLADEQIDEEGKSWRSGALAEKKYLRQWYIKTTAYSKSLFDGLVDVNRDLWRDVIDLQKYWIGECDGVRFDFKVKFNDSFSDEPLSVYTKRPEGIYEASHILISPKHPMVSSQKFSDKEWKLDREAVNPFTRSSIPMFYSEYFDFGEFLDYHLGIPALNKGDAEFVKKHLSETQIGEKNVDTRKFSGMERDEVLNVMAERAKKLGCGGHVTSERGRDWLISRQRYWGTPIPIIHCNDCGALPVPEGDLPVTLPEIENFTGKDLSPLKQAHSWQQVECPQCGNDALRETDTMDTFVDSSWYFLRFCDPRNTMEPFGRSAAHEMMPVDLYIGGKEHAIMHLYYARFFNHFLHDLGLVPTREPFVNLLTQGMVMGQSYRLADSGRYISPREVDFSGDKPVKKETGEALIVEWEKMSKSKYNGVDPQTVLNEFGTDSTRLCILSNVAPKTDRNWDSKDMVGILRWQARMWKLVTGLHKAHTLNEGTDAANMDEVLKWEEYLWDARNFTIKELTWNIGRTFLLNVAISRLQGFTNSLMKVPVEVMYANAQFHQGLCDLVVMLSPFAPMFASELWAGLQPAVQGTSFDLSKGVLDQRWPVNDKSYSLRVKVKRGNKDCYEVPIPVSCGEESQLTRTDYQQLVISHPEFEHHLGDLDQNKFVLRVQPGYKVTVEYTLTKKQQNEMKARKKKKAVQS